MIMFKTMFNNHIAHKETFDGYSPEENAETLAQVFENTGKVLRPTAKWLSLMKPRQLIVWWLNKMKIPATIK